MWIRQLLLAPLTALAPEKAIEVATSLAREDSPIARTAAVQGLGRLGNAGLSRLEVLNGDPVLKGLLPAVGRGGRAGGGPALPPRPPTPPRTEADYRQLVEKWIVPDYNGEKRPRAIWTTRGGTIELELFPGDAPMGVEYFVQAVASGDIIGTEFMRVVPNFVAQQQTIRYAPVLRDEVSRLGLLRGNLAWASGGLDTGRPGYTLATAPHPHIEGDFTSLGRVVKGMDVVDHIEWGDKILTAKMR
jgi:cyclophilin family peptidyl-prolyl cis-trans isomerase